MRTTRRRVVLICQDRMGGNMAGPALRYAAFAKYLSADHDVMLMVTQEPEAGFSISGVELVVRQHPSYRWIRRVANSADVVITQPLRLQLQHVLSRVDTRVIYDMYAPAPVELLETGINEETSSHRYRSMTSATAALEWNGALASGDAFLVASERQKTFLIGGLLSSGRLTLDTYDRDPSLDLLIRRVPFGLEPARPRHDKNVIKGVVPGIAENDFVLLWSGGVWNWLDPLTVIRAVANVNVRRPDVKLYFMGMLHPDPSIRMRMADQCRQLADELGVAGTAIHFNESWVPHAERGAYLSEADVGTVAHFDRVETHLAYRQRIVDHIWSGLPTITTVGSALSDEVAEHRIGLTVGYEDVAGWERAIERLASAPNELSSMSIRTRERADSHSWETIVDHLRDAISSTSLVGAPALPHGHLPRYVWTQARRQGAATALRKIIRSLRA